MATVSDMGGTDGWGRVPAPTADEPPFTESWQGRAFALTLLTMGRISGRNLDAFRHALGRLDRGDYLDDGYFGRWLNAAELMLTGAEELRDSAAQMGGTDLSVDPSGWLVVGVLAAVVSVGAWAAVVAHVPHWPEMGRRYDAPAAAPPGDLWKAMDQGHDPTS